MRVAHERVVVLKIGGSVLTDKNRPSTPKPDQIRRIAAEIKAGMSSKLVLVHGAGSFGHHQAREFGLKSGLNDRSIRGIMPTHNAVRELNDMIVKELYDNGVYAAPVHPLSACVLKDGRVEHMCLDVITRMLAAGIVPVLHGDVVTDSVKGIDVLSGDQLVACLAKELRAEKVGIGTNVDGVYAGIRADGVEAKDFKIIRSITPSNLNDVSESLAASGSIDVTGGMHGKIMELVELARSGITSCVFNAETPGNVARFLKGENIEGTIIGSV
ncbi:MAG TPA: isopentenyl phosphate kinase [Methanocella sp.]|jgi:isopentenyl phosphate kinase